MGLPLENDGEPTLALPKAGGCVGTAVGVIEAGALDPPPHAASSNMVAPPNATATNLDGVTICKHRQLARETLGREHEGDGQ